MPSQLPGLKADADNSANDEQLDRGSVVVVIAPYRVLPVIPELIAGRLPSICLTPGVSIEPHWVALRSDWFFFRCMLLRLRVTVRAFAQWLSLSSTTS